MWIAVDFFLESEREVGSKDQLWTECVVVVGQAVCCNRQHCPAICMYYCDQMFFLLVISEKKKGFDQWRNGHASDLVAGSLTNGVLLFSRAMRANKLPRSFGSDTPTSIRSSSDNVRKRSRSIWKEVMQLGQNVDMRKCSKTHLLLLKQVVMMGQGCLSQNCLKTWFGKEVCKLKSRSGNIWMLQTRSFSSWKRTL